MGKHYAFKLWGVPIPQGDMRCRGANGRHKLYHSNAHELHQWRDAVEKAASRLALRDYRGPVRIDVTFTIARPASVPFRARPWPSVRNGDIDKLARAVLDALSPREPVHGGKVLADDAVVVELTARKAYPDTPGMPDRLDRPGAVIHIHTI